jgi:CO/xanthine dehydrogenase Mo-binding subunit
MVRLDGIPKVMGTAQFAADLKHPGMLYGAMVWSPHPHARISAIDIEPALSVEGVVAVLTAKDIQDRTWYHH